ncbi:MAG: hypothetical protein V4687_07240 [Bacteroidota bacterium]
MKKNLALLTAVFFFGTVTLSAQNDVQPFQKGDFRIDLKLPHINYLTLNPDRTFRDDKFGFNGYGLGVEYSYNDNRFLEMSASIAGTFKLPFPAHIDAEYNKILYSIYINLTNNVILNRFSFGYGLNCSSNTWKEWTRDFDSTNLATTSEKLFVNNNLGLTFNSYYRVNKSLHLGVIYQPSLVSLNKTPPFIYEHLLSIEANWRIKAFSWHSGN